MSSQALKCHLPALIPAEGTHGGRVGKLPVAGCPAARCPGARGRRGAAGPSPSPAPCAPPSAGGAGNGGGSRAAGRGGQLLRPHPPHLHRPQRPRGAGGMGGQEGSPQPCGCGRSQAPPKLLNVSFIKAFRGLFFGVCLQTHKGRAAVWGSFLMEKGLGDPRHKRNPGSAFNGRDSMRGTLRTAGGGEGPPGAA